MVRGQRSVEEQHVLAGSALDGMKAPAGAEIEGA
jgi:hypothetical protein